MKTSSTGLLYKVEKEGTGEAPKDSDTVVVNYKGTLIDGKEFDNSYTRGEPLSFRLDGVIPGWTEGLKILRKAARSSWLSHRRWPTVKRAFRVSLRTPPGIRRRAAGYQTSAESGC